MRAGSKKTDTIVAVASSYWVYDCILVWCTYMTEQAAVAVEGQSCLVEAQKRPGTFLAWLYVRSTGWGRRTSSMMGSMLDSDHRRNS